MNLAAIRDLGTPSPVLVLIVGFHPQDEATIRDGLPAGGRIVDLDTADPGTPLEHPASGTVAVLARTLTDLRRGACLAGVLPKASKVVVVVETSVSSRPPALSAASQNWRTFHATREPEGGWSAEVVFHRARPAGEFLAALIRGLDGPRLPASQGARVALAGAGASHWRPGDTAVTLVAMDGPLGVPDEPPPADLVLRSVGPEPPLWPDARVSVIDRPRMPHGVADHDGTVDAPSDVDAVPPVDERSVNPSGFISTPEHGHGVLKQTGNHWSIETDSGDTVRLHPSGAVTDTCVARLRQSRAVTIDWGRSTADPIAAVRAVAGLATAGVPLQAAEVPRWAGALGAELSGLLTGVRDSDLADDLRREEHSVRLRRAALRSHSTRARWRNLAISAGLAVPDPPTISVILCTRRPEFVGFALKQIGHQRDVDLEVILTLHGMPADLPEIKGPVAEFDRPITVVEVPDGVSFGDALNRGAARSSGRFVAKWDDDDWYSPDFLADMLLASSYTGAELVGCMAQFVYLAQIDLTIFRAVRSEWNGMVSGGTFVLERSAFDAVGGFPPVPRYVDAALLDVLTAAGARIYRTHGLGYALHRRAVGHTWNQPVTYFLRAAALQWRGRRFSSFVEADENLRLPGNAPSVAT
jgi:hypothetical protein